MSQLGLILQESLRREREAGTILGFLREQMDGIDGVRGRRTLKERLGLKGMTCCGVPWGFRHTTISVRDNEDDDEEDDVFIERQNQEQEAINAIQIQSNNNPIPECTDPVSSGSGMNLAAALAAERQIRTSIETTEVGSGGTVNNNESGTGTGRTAPGTPSRVSLMRLLEETDGGDRTGNEGGGGVGGDSVCCVCMGRRKGAAFIPCGHTFCRVCSREMWLNRGSCPLCNRLILEILDIY